ncbi:chlorite dismutase family protein [Georgenia sp. TF02-10]|uniref:hydrogen peroxide-dependent heme synthase n=1 Tax=Georgenia sp. TF02-10 TaxID=2917725 RepID=UPI001FA79818|nr:hydrogen peroxide-dependent heme synthase [Georgenia sp. TF02-10]UNX54722.1 chlorite dismutase family protein [Georgenia sp. TF02-10]
MTQPSPARIGAGADTESINATIDYTMWSVFATAAPLPSDDAERAALVAAAEEAVAGAGVVLRGWYDVAGLRADADLMVWWHAPAVEQVQDAYHRLMASDLGAHLAPVWSVVGLHRPAEFNRRHVPAYLAGEEPGAYLCVYPFVRSYEWYLLPEDERRDLLREHGMAARDYPDVRANTVSAFALGDYEWILAFEAGELHRIVDVMRELRGVGARRHVREEVPFYTGPRVPLAEWVARQPRG